MSLMRNAATQMICKLMLVELLNYIYWIETSHMMRNSKLGSALIDPSFVL